MKISKVGKGNVVLIASPERCYTDIAARFVRSERDIADIIASPEDEKIIRNILSSGHTAATEFDYYLFGIEGYARPTEVQLVRKRLASYMIKTGRADMNGKREFSVVLPEGLDNVYGMVNVGLDQILVGDKLLKDYAELQGQTGATVFLKTLDILNLLESWYEVGVKEGHKEENLRYMKPQATEFKAIVGMNAHALLDWFKIRCCNNAQNEIRDLAQKMKRLCKQDNPVLFEKAGASCISLGYCPENDHQNPSCKGIMTHNKVLELIKNNKKA